MSKVEIYSKAMCPYCDRAKQLLAEKGVAYTEIRVDQDPSQMEVMLERSQGRRTFPQIFINDEPIGGFDDMWSLEKAGQLDAKLQHK